MIPTSIYWATVIAMGVFYSLTSWWQIRIMHRRQMVVQDLYSTKNDQLITKLQDAEREIDALRRQHEQCQQSYQNLCEEDDARKAINIDLRNQLNHMANDFNTGALAIREMLWIANVWNDHTFDVGHIIEKAEGIAHRLSARTVEDANSVIERMRERALLARDSLFAQGETMEPDAFASNLETVHTPPEENDNADS